MGQVPGGVAAAAAEVLGADLDVVGPTDRGESRSTFLVSSEVGEFVLKLGPGRLDDQHRLFRMVEGLRARGYPAPEFVGTGRVDGVTFTLQRVVPGELLDVAALPEVLPELLDVIELQRDAGDPDPAWPGWLLDTIERSGDGYCLHETMRRRPDTAALLDRVVTLARRSSTGPVRRTDVLHFDFSPNNILVHDGRLSGVVDWTVPFTGDRGFDVATLLFYAYEIDAVRDLLWERAVEISGLEWTTVYLCHLVLRQVEWTVRHNPDSPDETRYLRIATAVLAFLGSIHVPGSNRIAERSILRPEPKVAPGPAARARGGCVGSPSPEPPAAPAAGWKPA